MRSKPECAVYSTTSNGLQCDFTGDAGDVAKYQAGDMRAVKHPRHVKKTNVALGKKSDQCQKVSQDSSLKFK
jgi:hypothetical protein